MTHIRLATLKDRDAVHAVHLSAFPDEENQSVATLATELLDEPANPGSIGLVAETDDKVVGHVAFSPVSIENQPDWSGYILAPVGVSPDYQKHGIGSQLIRDGIKRLTDAGTNMLFVYGDPAYYGRFGFEAEKAAEILPVYELKFPFGWQAMTLNEGANLELPATITCVEPLNHPVMW